MTLSEPWWTVSGSVIMSGVDLAVGGLRRYLRGPRAQPGRVLELAQELRVRTPIRDTMRMLQESASPVRSDSTTGHAYLDLQQISRRREGRPTQELLLTYVLERFLYRLSESAYRDRLILKGGMLLAALGSRRPTADVDLLARSIDNEVSEIVAVIKTVLGVTVDDGVVYETDNMTAQVIRDAELYSGVRLTVPARIERARAVLRLDINVGDPVTPHPVDVEYPALLDGSFRLLGYPLETVLAEKVVTMIERGAATHAWSTISRMCSFFPRRHTIRGDGPSGGNQGHSRAQTGHVASLGGATQRSGSRAAADVVNIQSRCWP